MTTTRKDRIDQARTRLHRSQAALRRLEAYADVMRTEVLSDLRAFCATVQPQRTPGPSDHQLDPNP